MTISAEGVAESSRSVATRLIQAATIAWPTGAWRSGFGVYHFEQRLATGADGRYDIDEFDIAHETLTYQMRYNGDSWACKINGEIVSTKSGTYMGSTEGMFMPVQGENHAFHVQIGEMDPGRLQFNDLVYQRPGSSTWRSMDLTGSLNAVNWPYHRDMTQTDILRVWTEAH